MKKIYQYVFEDSEQNAEKLRIDIFAKAAKLAIYPEHFSLEKYKKDNDGTYRYFQKHRMRISYSVTPNEILIVRVRHTSMKPLLF